jgi:GNAT superfamily N-acetyltransferase
MERLTLIRWTEKNRGPFLQYIPNNMHSLISTPENICVGSIFGNHSCGAAIAEHENNRYYLRSIFIDPKVRLCGMGTYLLRGITGEVKKAGSKSFKFLYSPSMLAESRLSGIFERAGFRVANPVAISLSVLFGDLKIPNFPEKGHPGVEIMPLSALPNSLKKKYYADADDGIIPVYADVRTVQDEVLDFCTLACVVEGVLAGIIINLFTEGEIFTRSLYIYEHFRRTSITGLLIKHAIREAATVFKESEVVRTTPINMASYSLCEKVLGKKYLLKETEFVAEIRF